MIDDNFTKKWTNAGKLRKIRIVTSAQKGDCTEDDEDGKCRRAIAPGATKRERKIASKEVSDALPALRVGPVDAAVGADNQAI